MTEGPNGFFDRIKSKVASVFAGSGTPVRVDGGKMKENSASFIVSGTTDLRPLENADLQDIGNKVGGTLSGDHGPIQARVIQTAGKTRVVAWKETPSEPSDNS